MQTENDLAFSDELTGVSNRRFLAQFFAERWDTLAAAGEVAVLIVDLDRFKEVNDEHGHLTGDEALRTTARALRAHFRENDIVVRWGGDEFVVLVLGVGSREAQRLAERARDALASEVILSAATGKPLAMPLFSIGSASAPADGATSDEIFAAADRRLYDDKVRRGRAAARRSAARRIAFAALAGAAVTGAAVVGLLVGSWFGATGRISVVPVAGAVEIKADPAHAQIAALTAYVHDLEQRLATANAAPSPAPASPEPAAVQSRVAELESEIRALRQGLRPAPSSSPAQPGASATRRPATAAVPTPAVSLAPEPTPAAPIPTPAPQAEPQASASVQAPELLAEVRPRYPSVARTLRREAVVEIRVIVDELGHVVEAEPVSERAGYGFDESARDAALRTRFRAGSLGGVPLRTATVLRYRFVLD